MRPRTKTQGTLIYDTLPGQNLVEIVWAALACYFNQKPNSIHF